MEGNSRVNLADFSCNMGKASLGLNWFKPFFFFNVCVLWMTSTYCPTHQSRLDFQDSFFINNLCHIKYLTYNFDDDFNP